MSIPADRARAIDHLSTQHTLMHDAIVMNWEYMKHLSATSQEWRDLFNVVEAQRSAQAVIWEQMQALMSKSAQA